MTRTTTTFLSFVLAGCIMVLASADLAAAQTAVTTCGQETKGLATLNADLDCTGFDGYALTMHGGTLVMNGHTITGGQIGVWCDRNCAIVGPGTVTNSDLVGINVFGASLKMSGVDVTDHGVYGAQVWNTAKIEGPALFSGNGTAIRIGRKGKLKDLTLTGNDVGVDAGDNRGRSSIVVSGSTVSNNRIGLLAQKSIKVVDSTVTNNGIAGVYAAAVLNSCDRKSGATLLGSTVTGNNTDSSCGSSRVCADVATCKNRPRVAKASTCGTSYQIGSGNPGSDWDVCTLD